MSSENRRGLRIALSFTAAFVLAEIVRWDLQLTFIAPLVAGMLAIGPRAPAPRLLVLPIAAWLLAACAGLALGFLAGKPVIISLLALCVFYQGFKLFQKPQTATFGLLLLIMFSIIPETLIRAPELSADLAGWFWQNFAIAAACEWVTRRMLPDSAPQVTVARPPLLPPLTAAVALLVAVILVAAMQPPAPGAALIGVIIVLRADGKSAGRVIHDRFLAALLGGAVAVLVWEVLWLAPSLPVLATIVLLAAWPFARWIAAGGHDVGVATKSLNVLAILLGEGFSVFYADADDRIWTRIAGVVIGLAYASIVLSLSTGPSLGGLLSARYRAASPP